MATQRLSIIAVDCELADQFWVLLQHARVTDSPTDFDAADLPEPDNRVDHAWRFLLAQSLATSTLYFSQWLDRWSMGDTAPGFPCFDGLEVSLAVHSASEARVRAEEIAPQFPEYAWLATRLREAGEAVESAATAGCVVIAREVLGLVLAG